MLLPPVLSSSASTFVTSASCSPLGAVGLSFSGLVTGVGNLPTFLVALGVLVDWEGRGCWPNSNFLVSSIDRRFLLRPGWGLGSAALLGVSLDVGLRGLLVLTPVEALGGLRVTVVFCGASGGVVSTTGVEILGSVGSVGRKAGMLEFAATELRSGLFFSSFVLLSLVIVTPCSATASGAVLSSVLLSSLVVSGTGMLPGLLALLG